MAEQKGHLAKPTFKVQILLVTCIQNFEPKSTFNPIKKGGKEGEILKVKEQKKLEILCKYKKNHIRSYKIY